MFKIKYEPQFKKDYKEFKRDSLHFTASKTIDKVTGKVVSTVWTAPQDFEDFAIAPVEGYTPTASVVQDKDIAHDHADIKHVVTYNPDKQQAVVTFVDQTTGKPVEGFTHTLNGTSDEVSTYTTKDDLAKLEKLGYTVIEDPTSGKAVVFDHADKAAQSYVVALGHKMTDVSKSYTVTQTIHYQFADGSVARPDNSQALTFTQKGQKDMVTGQITWQTPAPQSFKSVDSPVISGYTPDKKTVEGRSANYTDKSSEITVTYTLDPVTDNPQAPAVPQTPAQPEAKTPEAKTPDDVPEENTPEAKTPDDVPEAKTSAKPEVKTPKDKTQGRKTPSRVPAQASNSASKTPEPARSVIARKAPDSASNGSLVASPAAAQIPASANAGAAGQNQLPQTGSRENAGLAMIGIIAVSLSAFGLAGDRKRKH